MATRKLLLAAALSSAVIAAPLEERQACSSLWGQCGGINWNGATCCASGSTCVVSNPYYSQCLPGGPTSSAPAATSSSTRSSSAGTSRTSTTPAGTSSTSTGAPVSSTAVTSAPPVGTGATWSGNPFAGVTPWANSFYASEISSLAIPSLTGAMATKAAAVAKVPTFQWIDTRSKIPLIEGTLADIRAANKAGGNYAGQFVVYDLPDRDCAAAASNGEYSIANGGVANYKAYIDAIRAVLLKYSDIRTLLVIEPDSLANMITNMNVAKCANAESAYLECTDYALRQLNLPHVATYMDAGHAGWLGWPDNLSKSAPFFANVYKKAGSPKSLRGLATNVANYNGWNLTSPPPYTQGAQIYDERGYVAAFAPLLAQNGFPAHFITDTGRSGKQPTGQQEWGHWCNAIGTGFGLRPTSNTGLELQDAFVWIKPGGECDGTSDQSAARYDFHCGLSDALQPAPEAGSWFQAYFVQLLTNANPAF